MSRSGLPASFRSCLCRLLRFIMFAEALTGAVFGLRRRRGPFGVATGESAPSCRFIFLGAHRALTFGPASREGPLGPRSARNSVHGTVCAETARGLATSAQSSVMPGSWIEPLERAFDVRSSPRWQGAVDPEVPLIWTDCLICRGSFREALSSHLAPSCIPSAEDAARVRHRPSSSGGCSMFSL